MSWQDNRRRKRVWYVRFQTIASELRSLAANPKTTLADILILIWKHWAIRKNVFRYKWLERSALRSLRLLIDDLGLDKMYLQPSGPVVGVDLAIPEPPSATMVYIDGQGKVVGRYSR